MPPLDSTNNDNAADVVNDTVSSHNARQELNELWQKQFDCQTNNNSNETKVLESQGILPVCCIDGTTQDRSSAKPVAENSVAPESGDEQSDTQSNGDGKLDGDVKGGKNDDQPDKQGGKPGDGKVLTSDNDEKIEFGAVDVNQRAVGDCFFEASLSSLVNTQKGKEAVDKMVKTNEDGTTTVTFPGDTDHPITMTQKEIDSLVDKGKIGNTDPTLIAVEAAFQKYDRIGDYGSGINSIQHQDVPAFAQITDTGSALHLLTGERTASEIMGTVGSSLDLGGANSNQVSRFIQQALANGEPVVAATAPGAEEPIVSRHVYSVLDYDKTSGMITVRNPWGDNEGTGIGGIGETKNGVTNAGDGKLTMSFDTFMKNFNETTAAGVNPSETRLKDLAADASGIAASVARATSDVFHGNFKNVPSDVGDIFSHSFSTQVDVATATVNELKSITGAKIRGIYDTVSDTLHGDMPSGSELIDALGPTQPVLDATATVVSDMISTGKDLWNDLF